MGKKNSRKKRGYHYSLSTLVLVHRKRFPLFCSCVSFLIVFFFFLFFFVISLYVSFTLHNVYNAMSLSSPLSVGQGG